MLQNCLVMMHLIKSSAGSRIYSFRGRIFYNGWRVGAVSVGGAARRYESRYFSQKALSGAKGPGVQDTMAQFLQIPAKDLFVLVAGTAQSRSPETCKRTKSFLP
jgi:hypothetical protein